MIGIFLIPQAVDVSKIKYIANLIKVFDKKIYQEKITIFLHKKDINLFKKKLNYLEIKKFGFNKFFTNFKRLKKHLKLPYISDFEAAIKKYNVQFAVFPESPDDVYKCTIPFIASIQSLGHRLNPELPETSQGKSWIKREKVNSFICQNAHTILIDSEVGKNYLKSYYSRNSNVIILPHNLPDEINIDLDINEQEKILSKHKITKPFLFYPAQLWPHKNHVRILEAINLMNRQEIDLQVVFTGSNKTIRKKYNIEFILKEMSRSYNLENDMIITGYLSQKEMFTLYKNALAMIMPQLLPEPCIPIVEAMGLGCPVIASNISGLREQVNNSGLLVDPYNIESIATAIDLLYNDESIRNNYSEKGYRNYESIQNSIDDSFSLIEKKIESILNNILINT